MHRIMCCGFLEYYIRNEGLMVKGRNEGGGDSEKEQLKCYLYTRVSTSMQVDGYSLDAQRDKLRKYAAYEDMIVAGEYSDEGFSGKEHSRAAGVSTDAE